MPNQAASVNLQSELHKDLAIESCTDNQAHWLMHSSHPSHPSQRERERERQRCRGEEQGEGAGGEEQGRRAREGSERATHSHADTRESSFVGPGTRWWAVNPFAYQCSIAEV